jgi:peptide chain release factor subunit 1
MFDEKSLKKLASLEASGPILSLYLNVDPTQHAAEEYRLMLREMLKQAEGTVDDADINAVKRYVDLEYNWSGRGLVVFSRQAEKLWHALSLAVPVRNGITAASKPYISPLVELDGFYGRYAVALIDRQGGRFFLFQMGELVTQDGAVGEDVRHVRKGRGSSVVGMRGGSQASGRKEAELVQRNLRDIAAALIDFCQEHHPRRLLLAGAEHTVAQFREFLPIKLQEIVVGTFNANMEAGDADIRDQAFTVLKSLEEKRHRELVDAVVTAAAKGMNGVVGLDQTLSVTHEGRAQVLVVEHGYHAPGYQCKSCGYLTTQKLDACVFCQGPIREIPDAAEAVISQIIEKGGAVEVVENGMLSAHIGALLRY